MVSNGKSLENGWFRGTTILGNLHVYYSILYHDCHKGRKWVKLDSSTRSTLFIQPLSLPQRPWLAQSSSRCRPRCLVQYFTFLSDLGSAIHISKQLYDFCIYMYIYIHIIYMYYKTQLYLHEVPKKISRMQPLTRLMHYNDATTSAKKAFSLLG